jgi:hypothetical protein
MAKEVVLAIQLDTSNYRFSGALSGEDGGETVSG